MFQAAGVFVLVFVIGDAIEGASPVALLAVGVILLAVSLDASRQPSGAQYNPAVTLALVLRHRIAPVAAVTSWTVQGTTGLLAAALAAKVVDPARREATSTAMTMAGWPLLGIAVMLSCFTFAVCSSMLTSAECQKAASATSSGLTMRSITVVVVAVAGTAVGVSRALSGATSIELAVTKLVDWPTVAVCLVAQTLAGLAAGIGFLTVADDRRGESPVPRGLPRDRRVEFRPGEVDA